MRLHIVIPAIALALALSVPSVAHAAPKKSLDENGSVPVKWNLDKPKVRAHSDVAPLSASGDGDGDNALTYGGFDDGDIIVTQGTATGHAGEWDGTRYYSTYSYCVLSANTSPGNGVQYEQPRKYNAYDEAYGLWVPAVNAYSRSRARAYCRAQMGEPYVINSSKLDTSRWYCSKLVWASYKYIAGVDLDFDSGYWVWPIDLVNDSQTSMFAYAR